MRAVFARLATAVRPQPARLGVLAVGVVAALSVSLVGSGPPPSAAAATDPVVAAVQQLNRTTVWTTVRAIPLRFPTYHPQGLARVGDRLYLSSVEVIEPPVRYPQPIGRYDRSPGRGIGLVHPREHGPVYGVSWGSRRLFAWTENGHLLGTAENESHYVDFQDCAGAAGEQAVCTGITEFPTAGGGRFDLGGIAVVDLRTLTVGHEVPVTVLSPNGHAVTRNPVLLEAASPVLRMWAAPDDGEEPGGTTLLVLEATLG